MVAQALALTLPSPLSVRLALLQRLGEGLAEGRGVGLRLAALLAEAREADKEALPEVLAVELELAHPVRVAAGLRLVTEELEGLCEGRGLRERLASRLALPALLAVAVGALPVKLAQAERVGVRRGVGEGERVAALQGEGAWLGEPLLLLVRLLLPEAEREVRGEEERVGLAREEGEVEGEAVAQREGLGVGLGRGLREVPGERVGEGDWEAVGHWLWLPLRVRLVEGVLL